MHDEKGRIKRAAADMDFGQLLKNTASWAVIGSDSPKPQPNHATWHNWVLVISWV